MPLWAFMSPASIARKKGNEKWESSGRFTGSGDDWSLVKFLNGTFV